MQKLIATFSLAYSMNQVLGLPQGSYPTENPLESISVFETYDTPNDSFEDDFDHNMFRAAGDDCFDYTLGEDPQNFDFEGSQVGCQFNNVSNNTAEFTQVFTDCAGHPLDVTQAWYRPNTPFEGKPNSIFYAGDSYGNAEQASNACLHSSMPMGSMVWCPKNQTESSVMWANHPMQPLVTINADVPIGVLTGYYTSKGTPAGGYTEKDYYCGLQVDSPSHPNYHFEQDFFNWAPGRPIMGKHRATALGPGSPLMLDFRAFNRKGAYYCELNCEYLTICEALNCAKNDATCTDSGTLESSFCVCNDVSRTWDPVTRMCRDPSTTTEGATTTTEATTQEPTTVPLTDTYHQTPLVFRPYAATFLNDFIRRDLNLTSLDVDDIISHGCWCGKLNANNGFIEFLGGPDPVDELDEICKNWFKCRNCNDRLDGGSCNIEGNSSKEKLLAGEYTIDYNVTTLDDASCINSIGDNCSDDTCEIDLYYAKKIRSFMNNNGGANSLSPIEVVNNSTCTAQILNDNTRKCEGTAPYLITKI